MGLLGDIGKGLGAGMGASAGGGGLKAAIGNIGKGGAIAKSGGIGGAIRSSLTARGPATPARGIGARVSQMKTRGMSRGRR